MNISRKRYRLLRFARIGSQTACLALFFFLFIKTDYTGSDTIEYAVNILFRIDPLLAFSTMLAMRAVIALMLPALFIVLLSVLFGRAICGWLCPLGSLIDFLHPLLKPLKKSRPTRYPHLAKIVLVFILITSFFGLPLAGYLD
ncbi:MAG: 4Fe-4S binding protein, partial [Deltaproteobacteria bacterium]|nr:4Fe-4S binding protein [Deltaproteobacteria bacterium]